MIEDDFIHDDFEAEHSESPFEEADPQSAYDDSEYQEHSEHEPALYDDHEYASEPEAGLDQWVADEPPDLAADPGSVGESELDSWLGSRLAGPPSGPSDDELINWTITQERQ